jgi:hypothetical protein
MLRSFLIALVVVQALVIFILAVEHTEVIGSAITLKCDPNCTYESSVSLNYFVRVVEKSINDPIAIFTLVLTGATILLAVITNRTTSHFRTIERAYVSGGASFDQHGDLVILVNNYGKTPADLDEVRAAIVSGPLTGSPDWTVPHAQRSYANMTLPPGMSGHYVRVRFPRSTINGIPNTRVYGRFFYRDIFNQRRSNGFVLEVILLSNNQGATLAIEAPDAYTEADTELGA